MRDLSVKGDSTCLQAILNPFGRTMTTIVEPAYRGVARSVPGSVPENPVFYWFPRAAWERQLDDQRLQMHSTPSVEREVR